MVSKNNAPNVATHAEMLKERIFQKEDELRERLVFLAMDLAPNGRGAYRYLEERTGIPATRWKNVMLKRQMPTLAMLIALMAYRRPYAEWLLTGDGLGKDGAPSSDLWQKFLKYREWMQENKSNVKEERLKWELEYNASMKKKLGAET